MTDLFQLTEDQLAIQEMARRFTADRITPFAAKWDEECHYPVDVWKAAGELGFGAIYVSEESGGTGLGRLEAALILTLAPHKILVGGGVGLGVPGLLDGAIARLPAIIAGYLPELDPPALRAMIAPPALGAEAGPLGAIALAMDAAGIP